LINSEVVNLVQPNNFEAVNHFYERVLNAQLHPLVKSFMVMSNSRIIDRYCHLHPEVDRDKLKEILEYKSQNFFWSGADLFPVTTRNATRRMVIVESNSCPSGQKSFPLIDETEDHGSYLVLIRDSFLPLMEERTKGIDGSIAVIYDKNQTEASGYAATIADLLEEPVYLVKYFNNESRDHIRINNDMMEVFHEGKWIKLKAVFKYLTQKPWNRIPVQSKTFIYNSIIACLAGGRNKLIAAKAYHDQNRELELYGLRIRSPKTIWDVSLEEIDKLIEQMGGFAVIKNPYSNAGQGVYTITNEKELAHFKSLNHDYELFIIQSLIGNSNWSSVLNDSENYYHIGTIPNKKNQFYIADLRMMICNTLEGYRPVAVYARQAKDPMVDILSPETRSWDILGTNLSKKLSENQWTSETNRLLLMDSKDFNRLGLGIDDIIEAFIQTVLASRAIDIMSLKLINGNGKLNRHVFQQMDSDKALIEEIMD
jgi:hypothetical protein